MKRCHLSCRANLFVASAVAALGLLMLSGFATQAKDPLNSKAWSFNVRNNANALNKAMMQWNAERVAGQGGQADGSGSAGGGLPGAGAGAGATANYSTITVILDDGAVGTIEIGTNQESEGNQSASSTSATIYDATIPVDAAK